MQNIPTITDKYLQQNTINARELYDFLEIKSKFADWIRRKIEKYGFIKNYILTFRE